MSNPQDPADPRFGATGSGEPTVDFRKAPSAAAGAPGSSGAPGDGGKSGASGALVAVSMVLVLAALLGGGALLLKGDDDKGSGSGSASVTATEPEESPSGESDDAASGDSAGAAPEESVPSDSGASDDSSGDAAEEPADDGYPQPIKTAPAKSEGAGGALQGVYRAMPDAVQGGNEGTALEFEVGGTGGRTRVRYLAGFGMTVTDCKDGGKPKSAGPVTFLDDEAKRTDATDGGREVEAEFDDMTITLSRKDADAVTGEFSYSFDKMACGGRITFTATRDTERKLFDRVMLAGG